MQYSYLIMLVAATVSARSTGARSSQLDPHHNEPITDSPPSQCHFTLPQHAPIIPYAASSHQTLLRKSPKYPTKSSSSIPPNAWPRVSTALNQITKDKQNTMQTWDLGLAMKDASLEGVMLGVVYNIVTSGKGAGRTEIKARGQTKGHVESEKRRNECVASAVMEVEITKQVEGVLEIAADAEGNGGGRASYLVYRVD